MAVALAAMAMVAAACGSSPSSSSSNGAVVKTASSPYGTILVDTNGMTLYAYSLDSATTSRCSGTCQQTWPPLTTQGTPQPQGGVDKSLLSTLKRSDGTEQVSYSGHPLYTFTGDTHAGQYNGQGVANVWHVVSASGRVIVSTNPTPPTSTSTSTTTPNRPTTTTTAPSTTTSAPTTSTTHPTTTTTSTTTSTSSTTTTTSP